MDLGRFAPSVDHGEIGRFGIEMVAEPFNESVVIGVTRIGHHLDQMVICQYAATVIRKGRTFSSRHFERPLEVMLGLGILTPDV